MIPKKIHYCWFGGNPLPEDAVYCINSWKKYLPDYEIIEWNESNFDLNMNDYVKEAFEAKKWAFITDYVRLYALYEYGGIYMDTDVEVIKNLDCFLEDKGFSGFEDVDRIPTGIMAAEKENKFIEMQLNTYNGRHFLIDGKPDLTTNVETITNYALSKGFVLNNKLQEIDDFKIYPKDYFCPKNSQTLELNITENTYTIHHFSGSWMKNSSKWKQKLKKILGVKICTIIVDFLNKINGKNKNKIN